MKDLLDLAEVAAQKAHAPYSGFRVGCALETTSGRFYTGCNVENASYGLTICAERNAVFHAVAEEGSSLKIQRLAVTCLGHEFPPCGACRQVIAEFALVDGSTQVAFLRHGVLTIQSIAQLLPNQFSLNS